MLKTAIQFIVVVILVFSIRSSAISHYSTESKAFPYIFTEKDIYNPRTFVADLDKDSHTEVLIVDYPNGSPDKSFVLCYSSDHTDQWHKHILNPITGNIQFIDLNNDGKLETLIPFSRNDSLYVRIVDFDGQVLDDFFLTSGKPRIKNNQAFEWDPDVIKMYYHDLDGDNQRELISVVSTGMSRQPRGIFVHSVSDKRLIGSCFIGSPPSALYAFDDFDGNGKYELIFLTSAPANGSNVNGLDDEHCNLVRIEFHPQPILTDAHIIAHGEFCSAHGFYANFTGDKKQELVTIRCAGNSLETAQIQVFDPVTFSPVETHDLNFPIKSAIMHQRQSEDCEKIWALTTNNELKIINNHFQVEKSISLPFGFSTISHGPDIDSDGVNEIVLTNSTHSVLINHKLKALAQFPGFHFIDYVKKGKENARYLIQGQKATVYRLDHNPLFFYYRYRRSIVFTLPTIAFLSVWILFLFTQQEKRTLDFALNHLYNSGNGAAAIINSTFIIKRYNQDFQTLLPSIMTSTNPSLSPLFRKSPQILQRLKKWFSKNNDLSFETKLPIDEQNPNTTLQFEITRLPRIRLAKRLYLVTIKDFSAESELERAQKWTLLARRIVHDIKNPLGAITLLAQRIRTRINSDDAQHHDITLYIDKIEGRIDSLRVMTRNLLKFANLEELHFAIADLNSFIVTIIGKIRLGLPLDISLHLDLTSENPSLFVDQEQLQSVIENLCGNAIDSMPKGGALSVTTRLAYKLQIRNSNDNAKDYAVIEFKDTGVGIPDDVLDRLFEPNYSYSKKSSGLGLAITKKIIDDHHGHIDVESEEGLGSIFTIYLPLLNSVDK